MQRKDMKLTPSNQQKVKNTKRLFLEEALVFPSVKQQETMKIELEKV